MQYYEIFLEKNNKILLKFYFYVQKKNVEHDDRSERKQNLNLTIRKDTSRRVSFKTNYARANYMKEKAEMGIRQRLEEDDDLMEVPRARRRGSPIPRSARGKSKLLVEAGSGWFQVLVCISLNSLQLKNAQRK